MKNTLSIIALLAAVPALADETRQLDAHEHGVGALNIAAEGSDVLMELEVPGADIVGFEYAAKTDADRKAVDAAVATLATPLDLFVLPAAAGCSVTEARAALEMEDEHAEHGHDDHDHEEHANDEHAHDKHDHDEHAHDDHGHEEHAHDEHKHDDDHAEHKDEHAHDDDHDHDHAAHDDDHDHADEATHSEFHATYRLTCADPQALDQIEFAYFDRFENALELEVQIVTGSGAQAFEVTREDPVLDLRNLF